MMVDREWRMMHVTTDGERESKELDNRDGEEW
jgi:hypothetical protein